MPCDIFATGQVTPAALAYLQTPGFQRGTTEQTVANASITGNLGDWGIQFPWAETGVGIALGVEYRKEWLELQTDVAFQTLPSSDLAGQGAPTLPVIGEFDVREAFAEVRIPIVEESFIHELVARGRLSLLRLRHRRPQHQHRHLQDRRRSSRRSATSASAAAYNRAVRAPNIQELFAPQRVALNGNGDPCAGDSSRWRSAAVRVARGVPGDGRVRRPVRHDHRPTRPASITA